MLSLCLLIFCLYFFLFSFYSFMLSRVLMLDSTIYSDPDPASVLWQPQAAAQQLFSNALTPKRRYRLSVHRLLVLQEPNTAFT
jgi:hypothetical protein